VSANIYDRYRLRQNETCRIGTGSLIGDAVLEFVPSGDRQLVARFDADGDGELDADERAKSRQELSDGDFMSQGVVASNPLEVLVNLEGKISDAFESLEGAGNDVSGLVRSFNDAVGDDQGQLRRIIEKTEIALDRFDSTMRGVENVLGDEELAASLKRSLEGLPEVIDVTRETMQKAGTTMDVFQRASMKAEARLDDIAGFTEPFRDNGPQLADNVLEITNNLKYMTAELQVFSEALNSQQGTFSRLVHDDELYRKIEGIVDNAEELSRKFGPIVSDVRTFTDKIARDPRQLGVKGALDRRPTGLKTGIMVP
jgi:phospholipid/cholesterol/gamma-HCH transport system substrate-binding protein